MQEMHETAEDSCMDQVFGSYTRHPITSAISFYRGLRPMQKATVICVSGISVATSIALYAAKSIGATPLVHAKRSDSSQLDRPVLPYAAPCHITIEFVVPGAASFPFPDTSVHHRHPTSALRTSPILTTPSINIRRTPHAAMHVSATVSRPSLLIGPVSTSLTGSCASNFCDWTSGSLARCYYQNPNMTGYTNQSWDDFKHFAPLECNLCIPETDHLGISQHCADVANNEAIGLKAMFGMLAGLGFIALLAALLKAYRRTKCLGKGTNKTRDPDLPTNTDCRRKGPKLIKLGKIPVMQPARSKRAKILHDTASRVAS